MVSPAAYAHFMHMMSSLAEGKVCAVLEVILAQLINLSNNFSLL